MTDQSRVTLGWAAAALIAGLLVATGAGAAYLLTRASPRPGQLLDTTSDPPPMPASHGAGHGRTPVTGATTTAPGAPLADVTITLTKEAVERAGIKVTPVSTGDSATATRLPGVVEPNAYRQVVVTPLVAGRVTRALVELGQRVERGQTMAQIFSPELAEAQTKFVSARAQLEAHEQELHRTEKLVEIGAASRQELERIHAEHTAGTAELQSARSRLDLLGVSGATADRLSPGSPNAAVINVPAPIAGVVTERLANVGLNVDTATKLFTVVDLTTVWVVADVYEQDLSKVPIGSPASVTFPAYPDVELRGRVSYIDPQVSAATRTVKVRVEVPNARGELRIGMLAGVLVQGSGRSSMALIPRSAVQNVDDRQVVYVANPTAAGRFIEREVRLGEAAGDRIPVLSGLEAGEAIVSEGSFYLRAERERLGLRGPTPSRGSGTSPESLQYAPRVTVSEKGFEPARIEVEARGAARITFVRTTDATCAKEVTVPSLNLKRTLPLNEPVTVEFTPQKTGEIAFVCGMGMLRGMIVVK